ncbi:MAG TPA: hypothetical protein VMJ92_05640, partial [Candidatus Limnocylindrales bacterium]|nr:hypothetical protein [Candidatus Limnocylindrales bacterium]
LAPRDAERLGLTLAGAHQLENAALAVAAARALGAGEDAVRTGLSRLRWPGRFEVAGDVVLDGAHNDSSAAALARTLRAHAGSREIRLVLGLNRDKDARAVLRPLLGLARSVHATRASGSPRALDPTAIAALCGDVPAHVHPSVGAAIEAARGAAAGGGIVCVTGSLALVGEARDALGLPVPERLWD